MRTGKFYEIISVLWVECMEIMKSKGTAYSGVEDKLGNFKRVAKNLSMTPYQVWAVYFHKHIDALDSWLRGEYMDSEPIEGRIKDGINYLLLLAGLIKEEQEGIVIKKQRLREEAGTIAHDLDLTDSDDLPDNYVSGTDYEGKVIVVDDKEEDGNK